MRIYMLLTIITILYIKNIYIKYYNIKNSLIEVKKLRTKSINVINKTKKIIIFIPLYQEEKIIESTVNFFSNIKNIECFYITTNKEGNYITNLTLKKLIKKNIKNIIHYPYRYGDKSNQINYAFQNIKEKMSIDINNTYFGFFDADSRPEKKSINYILKDKETPPIYQMINIYNSNYTNISSINQANSIFQTRWSFYFEFPRIFKNFYRKKKSFMYLIGHGLFLRGDILNKFPLPEYSVTEDIAYGYRMVLNSIFAKPIPYFDHCSVPRSIFHNIFQTARRFEGELLFYKEIFKKKLTLRSLWWMLLRYLQLAQRAFGPLLIIGSVIFSLINGLYIVWIILLTCIVLDVYSNTPIYNNFYKEIIHKKFYTMALPLLIKSAIDGIGPIFGMGKFINQKLLGVRSTFYRTPR